MWAFARYDLGIPSDEIWSLTPREIHMLADRHSAKVDREHARTALICFVTARVHGANGVKFEDFMPKRQTKSAPIPDDRMADRLKFINSLLGGDVIPLSPTVKDTHDSR